MGMIQGREGKWGRWWQEKRKKEKEKKAKPLSAKCLRAYGVMNTSRKEGIDFEVIRIYVGGEK